MTLVLTNILELSAPDQTPKKDRVLAPYEVPFFSKACL